MKFKIPAEGGEDEINMAPMIDMVFLLLIFFMVASHMSKMDRTPVELPVADKSKVPERAHGRQLITIRSHDQTGEEVDVIMNLKPVQVEEIAPYVSKLLSEDPKAEVYLRADRYAKHKHVKKVMAACAEGGVVNVIFATFESGN
ncbi:ExbD/TolR family protein [Pontiella agarivorans]|uniref:Biopolymer transporter ExbD n=1 Tax=Pontiella agarivorans TaxID=3038953 RepID=A0ABU5N006_9BACT|nr:biopolymer transporter ExbD [Pontiella agarivorans]MDZ8119766.1 biopolymer transporter ExbD [Pontiella agarivorans]